MALKKLFFFFPQDSSRSSVEMMNVELSQKWLQEYHSTRENGSQHSTNDEIKKINVTTANNYRFNLKTELNLSHLK